MDDLDLLKKDWKKQEGSLPHLSYDEIYKMLWKRSSSIVKWIFIISILEFLLGTILNIVLADDDFWTNIKRFDLMEFTIISYVVSYLFTFFFIFQFYKNYRRISTTDSASRLMKNILKTRKTVRYYIGFVLISNAVTFLIGMYLIIHKHMATATTSPDSDMHFTNTQWLLFLGGTLLVLLVFLGIIWVLYRLIYGILLRKLNRNYKELKKLEI